MGASLSCLDHVQDQSYTLSRKHVGRAESIAEYKARKNADKLKLLKKLVVVPEPFVEPVLASREFPDKARREPAEKPAVTEEEPPEKPVFISAEEEKPDVLISGPFVVNEKAQKTLPNDYEILPNEPEVVAGVTDEISSTTIPEEESNGLPSEVVPDGLARDSSSIYTEPENPGGATKDVQQMIYKETPTAMPAEAEVVREESVPLIKPRPVSNVSNVSEVPEFPELSNGDADGMMFSPSSEAMFADKSYAHPELEIGTKVCDPVTGMLVTVDEYRARSSQRSSGLVKEYVHLYEQIDESAMKDKETLEKQKSARISQRGMKSI